MKFRSLMTAICVLATANLVSAAPFAYIANSGTKTVSVIDTSITPSGDGSNTITATYPLPDTNPLKAPYAYSVAVGASGQYVYVGLQDTNEVAIFDITQPAAAVKRIGLGGDQPGGLAVNAAETRLYVSSNRSNTLIIIDITGSGASEVGRVTVDDSTISNPEGVVLSPDGTKAYVANSSKGTVAEIAVDELNNIYTRTALISLGSNTQPVGLAISSDGSKLYASSGLGGTASVVNTATRAATDLVVNTGNFSVAITPSDSKIYAPSAGYNNLYVIDGSNNNITELGTQNSLLNAPWGSSVSADGTKLYLAMNQSDNVKVFTVSSNTEAATIALPVGAKPTSLGDFSGPAFTYTINATNSTNCSILPLGSAIPANKYGRSFTITPASSYTCEVKVDGISVGQPSAYKVADTAVTPANHTIDASPIAGTFYTLTGDWISSVGGCLQSTPAGISCLSKSAKFLAGSTVTLAPTTGFQVQSGTWAGVCGGSSTSCSITMDADKSFGTTAVVEVKPVVPPGQGGPIKNETKSTYHTTLSEATSAASTNDVIKISTDYTTGGTTNGTAGVTVKMSSQWKSSDYTADSTYKSPGAITIGAVAVIADGLVI